MTSDRSPNQDAMSKQEEMVYAAEVDRIFGDYGNRLEFLEFV